MSLNGVTLDDEMLSVVLNTLGEKNLSLKKELAAAKVAYRGEAVDPNVGYIDTCHSLGGACNRRRPEEAEREGGREIARRTRAAEESARRSTTRQHVVREEE